jgi:type IV secretion system protein TrbJ
MRLLKIITTGALVTVTTLVSAKTGGLGSIVYDPTNHIENTISAVRAVAQDIKAAQAQYERIKSNLNSFKAGGLGETEAKSTLINLGKLIFTSQQLGGALGSEAQLLANVTAEWGASGQKWSAFAASKVKQAALGQSVAKQQMASAQEAMDQIKRSAQQRQAILAELPKLQGVTDVARTTTEMLNALVGVNENALMFMAQESKVKAIETAKKAGQEEAATSKEAALLKAQEDRAGSVGSSAYRPGM